MDLDANELFKKPYPLENIVLDIDRAAYKDAASLSNNKNMITRVTFSIICISH